MTDLIALLSSEKAAVQHVQKVIEGEEWETIFILKDKDCNEQIPSANSVHPITIDTSKVLSELIEDIVSALKDKVRIMDTAVNIICGSGKEHMALMSALLRLGVGIRFVAYTREGVKEI